MPFYCIIFPWSYLSYPATPSSYSLQQLILTLCSIPFYFYQPFLPSPHSNNTFAITCYSLKPFTRAARPFPFHRTHVSPAPLPFHTNHTGIPIPVIHRNEYPRLPFLFFYSQKIVSFNINIQSISPCLFLWCRRHHTDIPPTVDRYTTDS